MDPLTAISFAAAVVQMAEFGRKVLSGAWEVYKAEFGMTPDVIDLSSVETMLKSHICSIREKLDGLKATTKVLSNSEITLLKICDRCSKLCKDLDEMVKKFTLAAGKSSFVFDSLSIAMRKYWAHEEVKQLRRRVKELRQEMLMAMTVLLWEESTSVSSNVDRLFQQHTDMLQYLRQIGNDTRTMNQTLIKLVYEKNLEPDGERAKVMQSMWSTNWEANAPLQPPAAEETKDYSQEYLEEDGDLQYTKWLIETLRFVDFSYREDDIPVAFESTYQWLLKTPPCDEGKKPRWSNFPEWLECQPSPIYWITGKPGSGKSTLMKYVITHPDLATHLSRWSKTKPFIFSHFYFWNTGSSMQNSQEGLLRTLLYQCLSQRPQIVPKVCPNHWALYKIFGNQAYQAGPLWTWQDLRDTVLALNLYIGTEFNLALFIDGLDEFDDEHGKLVNLVQSLHSNPGAKICVSSRPWNVFTDAFDHGPSLRLHDLTSTDIEVYVRGKLSSNKAFQGLDKNLPSEAVHIVQEILRRAQGVFIWVDLVVRVISEALREGDRLSEIKDMVNEFEGDLSQLYDGIWRRIQWKQGYKAHCSELFQIYDASQSELDVVTMWRADATGPVTTEPEDWVRQVMERRLNSRTRGLLEVSQHGRIEYLHRTVRDWIKPRWSDVCSETGPDFDPNLSLLKAAIFKLQLQREDMQTNGVPQHEGDAMVADEYCKQFWRNVLECLRYAAKVRDSSHTNTRLIEALDRLNDECSSLALRIKNPDSTVPALWKEAMAPGAVHKWDQLPHWSTTQHPHAPESSFLALTARFAIVPYVRSKVTFDPKILLSRKEKLCIVTCAVLGDSVFDFEWDQLNEFIQTWPSVIEARINDARNSTGSVKDASPQLRYDLVRSLLAAQQEVVLGNETEEASCVARLKALGLYLANKSFTMGEVALADGRKLDYHDALSVLLEREEELMNNNIKNRKDAASANQATNETSTRRRLRFFRKVLGLNRKHGS